MQLTLFSDLALRVLMRLAQLGVGERTTAAECAAHLGASRAHVSKVVTKLVQMGLVHSVKGRGGGIALTQQALGHSVGQIVRELEVGEVVDCATCPMEEGCRLRGHLARAQEAFFASLDGVAVRDVVPAQVGLGYPRVFNA